MYTCSIAVDALQVAPRLVPTSATTDARLPALNIALALWYVSLNNTAVQLYNINKPHTCSTAVDALQVAFRLVPTSSTTDARLPALSTALISCGLTSWSMLCCQGSRARCGSSTDTREKVRERWVTTGSPVQQQQEQQHGQQEQNE